MRAPTEKHRIPLADGEALAAEVVALLAPSCARIEIAGSIRRRRADVGDIEILAAPTLRFSTDMFGEPGEATNPLEGNVESLKAAAVFTRRDGANRHGADGPRYKSLLYHGFALDLFIVLPPAQWGIELLIRTGPAEFSHRMVTKSTHGGLMPAWLRVKDGAVWDSSNHLVPTPEEADVWRIWLREPIPPEARGGQAGGKDAKHG